jgi:hypothetical protein
MPDHTVKPMAIEAWRGLWGTRGTSSQWTTSAGLTPG